MTRMRDAAAQPGAAVGARLGEVLRAACHPHGPVATSVSGMGPVGLLLASAAGVQPVGVPWAAGASGASGVDAASDTDVLVARLFADEGQSLVRLVRLFVDDRNAAEDLVQEGFIKLARNAHRIEDRAKAAAYLRSIVLNLARDHNRRGLVSLRHHLPLDDRRASTEDEIALRDDQREVIDALRSLPHRQRTCLVLRYYDELGVDEIADTLEISRNSVKTHLKRGLRALAEHLGTPLAEGDLEGAGA
jgi:RNA polymerase sigma-70 factor (sigma-E family)